jgi:predicted PurR-regulated permease PerM
VRQAALRSPDDAPEEVRMTPARQFVLLLWLVAAYFLLRFLAPILAPFLLGALLAYVFNPLVIRLERWHVRRPFGVGLVILGGLLVGAGVMMVVVPIMIDQVNAFAKNVPGYMDWVSSRAIPWVQRNLTGGTAGGDIQETIRARITEHLGSVTSFLQDFALRVVKSGKAVALFVGNVLVTLVIFIYLLGDWNNMPKRLPALFPQRHEPVVRRLMGEADEALGAFLRGQLIVMLYIGVALSVALLIIGLDLALPIGLLGGLISFIPYLGSSVTGILMVLAAVIQFHDVLHPLLAIGLYFAINQVADNVLMPRIVGNRIGVHPVALIFALLVGGRLLGLLGLLIAIPAAAVINVVARYFFQQYREGRLMTTPARQPRPPARWPRGGPRV